jgi:hypothetical protein
VKKLILSIYDRGMLIIVCFLVGDYALSSSYSYLMFYAYASEQITRRKLFLQTAWFNIKKEKKDYVFTKM